MFLIQVNNNDGVLKEITHVGCDRSKAETAFFATCEEQLSNWDEYTSEDRNSVLHEGYAQYGCGCIMFIDTDGFTSDAAIRDELTHQPAADVTIVEILHEGELDIKEGMDMDEVLKLCGGNLDSACSWDIQGQVVFKGSDGKFYTITTESIIGECDINFITDVLSEIDHE